MPIDYSKYPINWADIRTQILKRAAFRCEGSPKYPECRAEQYRPHPETSSRVVLTVAHLDHDVSNNAPENLRAWCQRCHLTYDAAMKAAKRKGKRGISQPG